MMKIIARMLVVVMSVVMMGMAFTACSVEKDVVGDWTVSTINGKTCEEYAAPLGVPANMVALNLKIEKDKATMTGVKGSQEFKVAFKSNGVELTKDGNPAGSLLFDKSAQTLKMQDNSTGSIIEYVFKKGTTDLTVADQAQPAEDAQQPADDAQQPADDAQQPADDAQQPADDAQQAEGQGEDELTGEDYGERTEEEMAEDDQAA